MKKKTILFALLLGCSRTPTPTAKVDPAPDAAQAPAPPAAQPSADTNANACKGDPSKGVSCERFATAEEALKKIVGPEVQVLAVGEAHAQKGTEGIASSTKRFTEQLLPAIASRSGDLVVELWAPDPKCQKEVKAVASAQKPVTQTQAATNVNEYDLLGREAKKLGMTPWLLRPTCDDFSMLADAGADVVEKSLLLIKRLTLEKTTTLMAKNVPAKKLTITYGGALHNDVAPPPATAAWSFGPDLVKATNGNYVELDLIVPEFVKKTETWEKLPWFSSFMAEEGRREKTTLYTIKTGDKTPPSYVLVFPTSNP